MEDNANVDVDIVRAAEDLEAMKNWIDNASYEELLRRWRFAKVGDLIFQGEIGKYYAAVMRIRKIAVGVAEHCRVSKAIEWSPSLSCGTQNFPPGDTLARASGSVIG